MPSGLGARKPPRATQKGEETLTSLPACSTSCRATRPTAPSAKWCAPDVGRPRRSPAAAKRLARSQPDSLPSGFLTFLSLCPNPPYALAHGEGRFLLAGARRAEAHAPNLHHSPMRVGVLRCASEPQYSCRFVVSIEERFRPASSNNTNALRSRVNDCQESIRADEAAPVRRRRSPARATDSGVPQRRHLRLLGDHPLHRSLPPTRGATACVLIVACIAKRATGDGGGAFVAYCCHRRQCLRLRHVRFARGNRYFAGKRNSAGGGTRTHTRSPSPDFESGASTDSATPAWENDAGNCTTGHTCVRIVDTEKRARQ